MAIKLMIVSGFHIPIEGEEELKILKTYIPSIFFEHPKKVSILGSYIQK